MPSHILYSVAFFVAIAINGNSQSSEPVEQLPSDKRTVELLEGLQDASPDLTLWKLGDRMFPVYHRMLCEQDVPDFRVERILQTILSVDDTDRSQFIPLALANLASSRSGVRCSAATLIGTIGTQRNVGPLVSLLYDTSDEPFYATAFHAARAIVNIGGPADVVAFDIWLIDNARKCANGVQPKNNAMLRGYMIKCRDRLKARIADPRAICLPK